MPLTKGVELQGRQPIDPLNTAAEGEDMTAGVEQQRIGRAAPLEVITGATDEAKLMEARDPLETQPRHRSVVKLRPRLRRRAERRILRRERKSRPVLPGYARVERQPGQRLQRRLDRRLHGI